jgi:hypothetical protein
MTQADEARVVQQLQRIRVQFAERQALEAAAPGYEAERSIDEASRLARISAHWGIASSWPVGGRLEVLGKRVLRILLRWYINPIVEQQNDFNAAVLRSLYMLESEVHALRVEGLRGGAGRSSNGDAGE